MLETWWVSSFQGKSSPSASKSPSVPSWGRTEVKVRVATVIWNPLEVPKWIHLAGPASTHVKGRSFDLCHGREMCTWQMVGGILLFYVLCSFGCGGSLLLSCGLSLVAASWLLLLWSTGSMASVVAAHRLSSCDTWGLVAPWHVESSWTRDQNCVPCIEGWILLHCATREA